MLRKGITRRVGVKLLCAKTREIGAARNWFVNTARRTTRTSNERGFHLKRAACTEIAMS